MGGLPALQVRATRSPPTSKKISAKADAHHCELPACLQHTVKITGTTEYLAGVKTMGADSKHEFELGFIRR